MSGPELSVLVPCKDEELNLPELVSRILAVFERGGFTGEIVLVDDGSTDGTARVLRELTARHGARVVAVFHEKNRGIAEAWRSAALAATGRLVATIDADLQYQPEDLLRLRRALYESAVDVVQGWRSPVGRERDERYGLSRAFNFLLNTTFSMRLRDNKSGFVMCAREVFVDLLAREGDYFYWQSFVMVAAHAKGYAYREVETLFEPRKQGQSFLSGSNAWKASARSLVDLGKAAWFYRVKRSPPDVARQFLPTRAPTPEAEPAPEPAGDPGRMRWRAYVATFGATHWTMTADVEHYLDALERTQWLEPKRLAELQDEKLRRLIRHAYRDVPFHRARMQELGLRPEDIRTTADLAKLPLLSKSDIREHLYFDILSEHHEKSEMLRVTTSGSTGEPFVCFADRAQLELRWAATLRSQRWTGYAFGDPTVRLWHQTLGLTSSQAARERADALLSNRTFIPVFELNDESLARALRVIRRASPTLVDGYAEALDLLARFALANPELAPRVPAVMSSAQTLPAASRAAIERAFGCRVFDKYGSREFSGIAYECDAHRGHHVVGEAYIVEILRDGAPARPGELGEVVITDLTNRSMPFIRYRIGDLAVARDPSERCPCGRGLPLIGDVEGRVQSIVRGANGAYLPGTFFAHYLRELDYAVRRFQVIQREPGELTFRFVKGPRFSNGVLDEILETFRAHLGSATRIDVQSVDRIDLVRTGKAVAVESHLAIDFQRGAPPSGDVRLRAEAPATRVPEEHGT
jgi:phenylacetate-CoA ligase